MGVYKPLRFVEYNVEKNRYEESAIIQEYDGIMFVPTQLEVLY